jgi:hypothetical protein
MNFVEFSALTEKEKLNLIPSADQKKEEYDKKRAEIMQKTEDSILFQMCTQFDGSRLHIEDIDHKDDAVFSAAQSVIRKLNKVYPDSKKKYKCGLGYRTVIIFIE